MVGHPSQLIFVFNDNTAVRRGFLIQLRLLQDLEEVEMGHEGQVHAYDPRGDQLTRSSGQQESRVVTLKLPDQV